MSSRALVCKGFDKEERGLLLEPASPRPLHLRLITSQVTVKKGGDSFAGFTISLLWKFSVWMYLTNQNTHILLHKSMS